KAKTNASTSQRTRGKRGQYTRSKSHQSSAEAVKSLRRRLLDQRLSAIAPRPALPVFETRALGSGLMSDLILRSVAAARPSLKRGQFGIWVFQRLDGALASH